MKRHARALPLLAAFALVAPVGCGDDAPPPAPPAPPRPANPATGANAPGAAGANAANRRNNDPPPPQMQITDNTFSEPPSRDPFRSYARLFVTQTVDLTGGSRDVKLARYSLDDLHLVAVVVGTDSPYAMVVDPSHAGTILRRGMYVGRAEVVHALNSRGQDYAVNWRVARINPARVRRRDDGQFDEVPAEVVFERQNPLDPTAQVVERSITLASGVAGQQTTTSPPVVGPIPGVGAPVPTYLPSNLGGVTGGSANGAILGTQSAVNQAVGNSPPQQTTVVVQVPPQQPSVAPVAPSNAPPPVQIFNGTGTSR